MGHHVVGQRPTVRIPRRPGRVVGQHVGQGALGVDRGDRLVPAVPAGAGHRVDERPDPQFPVAVGFAGVVLVPGVLGGDDVAQPRLTGPVHVDPVVVLQQAAARPDPDIGSGAQIAGGQFDHHRDHVGFGVGVLAGAVEINKRRVAARTCEEGEPARLDDLDCLTERHVDVAEDPGTDRRDRGGLVADGEEGVHALASVDRWREREAEREVVAQVPRVVDGQPVHGIRVQRTGIGVGGQDDRGP